MKLWDPHLVCQQQEVLNLHVRVHLNENNQLKWKRVDQIQQVQERDLLRNLENNRLQL